MSHQVLAVVSVLGKDQKGVVAQFATYLAERGINIEDIEQRVVRGFFLMDMLVDLKDLSIDLSELVTGLLELGRRLDMEVRVHLHSERREKKVAILVSKEPHCLKRLIDDFASKKVNDPGRFCESSRTGAGGERGQLPIRYHQPPTIRKTFRLAAEEPSTLGPDLVGAGDYMRILPQRVVAAFRIGSSTFIPRCCRIFRGRRRTNRHTRAGVRVHGCTAHFVTEQLDEGPVILQDVFHINVGIGRAGRREGKGPEPGGRAS